MQDVYRCFDNLIGVIGCNNTATLLVNDLSGISNELIDKIADGDNETYYDVFEKARKSAINTLKTDILDVLLRDTKRVRFNEVLFKSEQARLIKPTTSELINYNYLGGLVTTASSRYVLINVNSISVYVTESVTVKAKVYDYESEEFIFEGEDVTLEANKVNQIEIGKSLLSNDSRAVAVVLELQGLDTEYNVSKLKPYRFKGEKVECQCVDSIGEEVDYSEVFQALDIDEINNFAIYPIATNDINDAINFTSIDSYVSIDVDIVCSMEQFICENAQRIAPALVYLVGANILKTKLGGYRCNNFAKGNLEFTKETKDELLLEYRSILDKIVPTLPLNGDSMCWECDKEYGIYSSSLI